MTPEQREETASPAKASSTEAVAVKERPALFSWRLLTLLATVIAFIAILTWVPVPFVVNSPGPTFNILGSARGEALISISGTDPTTGENIALDAPQSTSPAAPATPGEGQLRMVTVSESGGPGNRLNMIGLIGAYFDPHSQIFDYDALYPSSTTRQQVNEAQNAMMRNSQNTSQVAALQHLGWDVPATVTIEGTSEGSSAENLVQQGDILSAITTPDGVRHDVTRADIPFALMKTVPADSPMTLTIIRDGVSMDVTFPSVGAPDGESGSRLGLYLSVDAALPLDISFNLEGIGGPSAGMMFSLGIIDRLTPGDMTGGQVIAGTGTMSYDGQVGAIGGIVQKMWGAYEDGATWFLAPETNCSQVVGNVPDGLNVVRVSTLDEAVAAVRSIAAGEGASLPTCEAS